MPETAGANARRFYLDALSILRDAGVPYLIGGGYAVAYYTGIPRQTKDLDLYIFPADRDRALAAMQSAGYRTEIPWPHFLAKALKDDAFIDLLQNSGNGLSPVDEEWFAHAHTGIILGAPQPICPVEEKIWSKAFVQDRDRYDGADIAHLILARGHLIDWERLLRRFEQHEPVLLAHLILFQYVYPSERQRVPAWAIRRLSERSAAQPTDPTRICQGTFLAKRDYLPDLIHGFTDPRLAPLGPLTAEHIARFTE